MQMSVYTLYKDKSHKWCLQIGWQGSTGTMVTVVATQHRGVGPSAVFVHGVSSNANAARSIVDQVLGEIRDTVDIDGGTVLHPV
jgi:hypothetical protein